VGGMASRVVRAGHVHARHVHRGHAMAHGLGDSSRCWRVAVAEDESTGTRHEAGRDHGARNERH
jgi:hypothetical protein